MPSSARLTLISHAPIQAQRRAAFPLDEPLEQAELEKVAALKWSAPRAERILSGPEHRTQQTAKALGFSPEIVPALRDCDYGAWIGRELSHVQLDQPDDVAAWLTDPGASPHGGESILNLIGRIGRWLDLQHDAGHTVAITHSAVIRSILIHALQAAPSSFWRIDIAPLSATDLRWNGRVWTVRSSGCALPGVAGQP
jgi:broad specificity phosphatase PhoE